MKYIIVICSFLLFFSQNNLATEDSTNFDPNKVSVENLRVLVFSGTGWYRHLEIPMINGWLVRLGYDHGIQIDISETGNDITEDFLKLYDVVLFNNANSLDKVLNEEQQKILKDWYQNGGGIVGLHAALVHQKGFAWFSELAGCDFNSDSDFQKAKVIIDPNAYNHPIIEGFGTEFWYSADWHNHTNSVTGLEGVEVLMRVDESTYEPVRDYFKTRGGEPMGDDHPAVWTREYDGGRFFYSVLGHDLRSLDTDFGHHHIVEGIRWVANR